MSTSQKDLTTDRPGDHETWDSGLAWRTLGITTYSMVLAFCVWFLVSAIASYLSIRLGDGGDLPVSLERCADICFVIGLIGLTLIAVLFAYETI